MVVNTWFDQVEVYLNIVQSLDLINIIDDALKISFASRLLKRTAVNWWYAFVQSGNAPTRWEFFKGAKRIHTTVYCAQIERWASGIFTEDQYLFSSECINKFSEMYPKCERLRNLADSWQDWNKILEQKLSNLVRQHLTTPLTLHLMLIVLYRYLSCQLETIQTLSTQYTKRIREDHYGGRRWKHFLRRVCFWPAICEIIEMLFFENFFEGLQACKEIIKKQDFNYFENIWSKTHPH